MPLALGIAAIARKAFVAIVYEQKTVAFVLFLKVSKILQKTPEDYKQQPGAGGKRPDKKVRAKRKPDFGLQNIHSIKKAANNAAF